MALQISENGPEFPDDFLDSLLAGEVVFLCGTGVSAPQMPDFRCLVERTYETLGVERTGSEELAFDKGHFEEVLGSLSRRLSDPQAVTSTVSDLLAVPDNPVLDQHHTILRLSRDLDNRICVVTTNFDTLLEQAIQTAMPGEPPRNHSFAGQALPAPGSALFSGIIHIHGRLGDAALGLEPTPLVLTSAEYGDAYMRSGWASRFLFDLARCKSIVLVGYSANDAPVRYFLNVLEADRARFPDLKTVYALTAYEHDPEESFGSWGTLAVIPLPYCKVNPGTGSHDHSPLWRDLAELADIADRPKQSRQERARAILEQSAAKAGVNARKELGWLFGGRRDLWPIALNAISDPEWFQVFQDDALWSAEDAAWVIAAWIAKNFQDRHRLECACEWQRRLGRPFTENIERQLTQKADDLEETWHRAWRLFCLAEPVEPAILDPAYHAAQKQLTSSVVLDSDLQKAVSLLTPKLELRPRHRELQDGNGSQPIVRFSDIVWPRMAISDVGELIEALLGMPNRAGRILDLATAQLQSTLELEADLEQIGGGYDVNDFTVPSIERHDQNQLIEGVNFLVRVLADSLCQAAALDRDHARRVVVGWKKLPGRIGLRLCLHAMRDADLFDANEAMNTLLSVSDNDFWAIRREIALLLKDRAGAASRTLVRRVEKRIRESGDAYYARYIIQPGETDWHAHARDTAVWLRLNMLREAGVLSKTGFAELSAIKKRRDYLHRAVEDRDFFGSYASKAHFVAGDPAPIMEADEDDRLQVARELAYSHEVELRQGWSAFCRSDPQAAFDSLHRGDLTPANGALWNTFLGELAFNDEASKAIRDNLATKALNHLAGFSSDALQPMVSGLVDLIYSRALKRVGAVQRWLDRLWKMVSEQQAGSLDLSTRSKGQEVYLAWLQQAGSFDLSTDLYRKAISSPEGKLSRALLLKIDARRKRGLRPTRAQRRLLRRISEWEGVAGQLGRAMLVRYLAFLLTIDRQCVTKLLKPRIGAENAQGAALRDVMLRYGSLTPELTQVFGQAIRKGAIESKPVDYDGSAIASKILRTAIDEIRGRDAVQWGLTASDAAQVLREASQAIRIGALTALAKWIRDDQTGAESAWCLTVAPFFERVWPKEREFRDASLTPHLIDLAVGAGNEFPRALELLQSYIVPYDRGGYGSLHSIASSEAPEKFPRQTLDLLWLVCGRNSRGSFYEISEIIDRLIEADPDIEIDRRLQWLEHRAVRYD